MAKKQDSLFPDLPEDLSALSDDELSNLLQEHEVAADLIAREDADFTAGLDGAELLAQLEKGMDQIEAIEGQQAARVQEQEEYQAKKAEQLARRKKQDTEDDVEEAAEEGEELSADAETAADESGDEGDDSGDDDGEGEKVVEEQEEVAVVAAADVKPRLRRPPAPSSDRMPDGKKGAVLVAAAGVEGERPGAPLDRIRLAKAYKKTADRWGRVAKHDGGMEQRILVASANFDFPEERVLHQSDWEYNAEKIAQIVPQSVPGMFGFELTDKALVASGGLCAPLEPIYSIPNFATQARPVRDALPSFRADRGGVNVGAATYVGDITTAISTITEPNDALGGTFATKSCQALDCPTFTEVPVTVIAHCREYGNLNAMAWPEKIAHENDLTMAAHARTAEGYLLDRIKALSVNVTNGAETLGALIYLIDGIVKASFGIRGRLRMSPEARFRVLMPWWVPPMLGLDTVQTSNDVRFASQADLVSYLRSYRIEPTFYLDTPSTGTTQLPDSSQTAAALDALPDNVQWAIFPEGAFIHVDSGGLELGIVRDSTLNSTNDYQFFGETFENVALLGPAQGAYWVTSDLCASGQFPPAGTARTCD
jgi:hypothetical protein